MCLQNVYESLRFTFNLNHFFGFKFCLGSFLIPFFIFMIIEGVPLFLIELGIGQRFRKSALQVWRDINKCLTGIGVSSMIASIILCIYYIIVITWCVYYSFLSITSELPWLKKNCHNYELYVADNSTTNKTLHDQKVKHLLNLWIFEYALIEIKTRSYHWTKNEISH